MSRLRILFVALMILVFLATGCRKKRKVELAEIPREITPVEEIYQQGVHYLEKNRSGKARRYFDQIALREDAGDYKELADIGTADAWFIEHSIQGYAEAISRYQSFLAFHPTHPKAPYCQLQIARAYLEEMSTPDRDTRPAKNALISLDALIDNYPESAAADKGRELKRDVSDFLAAHEIKVGDYYFKEGSYSASIERYQTVLRGYPEYWNLPLVHARLAEAYYRYGDYDKAANYFTEVTEEAPGTRLASNADKRLQRIESGKGAGSKMGKKPSDKDLTQTKNKRWYQFWKKGEKKEKSNVQDGELVKPKKKRWWQFWK